MRKYLLFILLIFLFSCKIKKGIFKDKELSNVDTISNVLDTNLINNLILEDSTYISLSSPHIIDTVYNLNNNTKYNIKQKSMVEIIDQTDSNNISKGIIAYSVPNRMRVGQNYIIKIRITKDRSGKNSLIVGDRNIPINDTSIDSRISIEDIRVESIMTAELICDTSVFIIKSLSSKVQNIDDSGYTEWAWLIKPTRSGNGYLRLVIKVRTDDVLHKDIVVFDKNIYIDPDRIYMTKSWLDKYWQWLISTVIIPFIVWLWKRRSEKKKVNLP